MGAALFTLTILLFILNLFSKKVNARNFGSPFIQLPASLLFLNKVVSDCNTSFHVE